MKATALLKKQHRRVQRIFERLENNESDASTLLTELANDLAAHMAIEQTIFYPAVRDVDSELVSESYQEHAIAELALKRLLSTTPDDETFVAKVTVLRELIGHHVEEEEDQLFPEVEDIMDGEQLDALGGEMQSAFEEAFDEGYEALLPEGTATSADDANQSPTKPPRKRAKQPSASR